jgi:hypothetical protein
MTGHRHCVLSGGIEMIRHAAVVVAMCLAPSSLFAQGAAFTVTSASANVHKSPSTGSPVIGRAPRGAVLVVTRELGSWVKIDWPSSPDGVGYLHVSTGSLEGASTRGWNPAPGNSTVRPASDAAAAAPRPARAEDTTGGGQLPAPRPVSVTPAHLVGLGGRLGGPTLGFGATGRLWSRERLGVQLEVSREVPDGAVPPDRVRSIRFAPSLLYSLPDHVSYHVWLRPYLGTGANLERLTLESGRLGGDPVSEVRLGLRALGGAEVTLASVPRFALSADLSYQWFRTPLVGVELGGLGLSVSGHWYVR